MAGLAGLSCRHDDNEEAEWPCHHVAQTWATTRSYQAPSCHAACLRKQISGQQDTDSLALASTMVPSLPAFLCSHTALCCIAQGKKTSAMPLTCVHQKGVVIAALAVQALVRLHHHLQRQKHKAEGTVQRKKRGRVGFRQVMLGGGAHRHDSKHLHRWRKPAVLHAILSTPHPPPAEDAET